MKNFFKATDFLSDIYINLRQAEVCADKANALLSKSIEAAPTIYGDGTRAWLTAKSEIDTHTARLMFIEEIVKKPCEHRPLMHKEGYDHWTFATNSNGEIYCSSCNVPLDIRAVWSEKE